MMDDSNPFTPAAALPETDTPATAQPDPAPASPIVGPSPTAPATPELSPAVQKFKSCRWRADPEAGEFCTHRDVLPFAGKTSFNADSWCPECSFYKLRRTPKKRERADYTY
jgi:hypothetical protein